MTVKELRLSGYGTHLSNLFIGSILYADDICLISHSCFGLQKCWMFVTIMELHGTFYYRAACNADAVYR